tara:strand:- start:20726 stop:21190 length:465 start_codon:yes stop_codon:yes gene_type:complete
MMYQVKCNITDEVLFEGFSQYECGEWMEYEGLGMGDAWIQKVKMSKITTGLDEILQEAEEQGVIENEFNWELVREQDKLTMKSKSIKWLEFNADGTFKEQFQEAAIGRSLIMSPFNAFFTWQTTNVTEIVEQREDYIKFKTQNSNYELNKLGYV